MQNCGGFIQREDQGQRLTKVEKCPHRPHPFPELAGNPKHEFSGPSITAYGVGLSSNLQIRLSRAVGPSGLNNRIITPKMPVHPPPNRRKSASL
jgi:hypothetical protein